MDKDKITLSSIVTIEREQETMNKRPANEYKNKSASLGGKRNSVRIMTVEGIFRSIRGTVDFVETFNTLHLHIISSNLKCTKIEVFGGDFFYFSRDFEFS